MRLRGTACLVTGGSSGIGRATAVALARAGAVVTVLGRDEARLREVADGIGGRVLVADLARPADVARSVAEAGRVDVLVNNAGLGLAGPFADVDAARLEEVTRVNLVAPALLARELLPAMIARGTGHVVNVASVAGHVPVGGEALYAATKAGLVSLTQSLRQELAGTGVSVTLVSPGVVDTAIFERRGMPYDRSRPRPVAPERVAAAIVRGIERDAPLVVSPWWLRGPIALHRFAPRAYERLARRFG